MPDTKLTIYGAREHNLKDITLELPRGRMIVFTGVSGSGKSSLAIDTIYAEGQRRYVESLSTHTRQFLGDLARPEVDHIEGLSPAIAIDQRSASGSIRSTVATLTEIYDYLRVLFARAGIPHCYGCGEPITAHSVTQITDEILALPEGTRVQILAPAKGAAVGEYGRLIRDLRQRGFSRVRIDGEVRDLSDRISVTAHEEHRIEPVVDRLVVSPQVSSRLAESIETALEEGDQVVIVNVVEGEDRIFSSRLACPTCGISFPEITPQLFSFNNPAGACPQCGGLGVESEMDPELLVLDPHKSLLEGALDWQGDPASPTLRHTLEGLGVHYGFDLATPWEELSPQVQRVLLWGSEGEKVEFTYAAGSGRQFAYRKEYEGLASSVGRRRGGRRGRSAAQADRLLAPATCRACKGARLRPEALAVRVGELNIAQITALSIEAALRHVAGLHFEGGRQLIANELFRGIRPRLSFLAQVGLGYLTLDRPAPSLSGGEAQRIRLATQMGSALAGVLYILDEPSVGLHQRDQARLLEVLFALRDLGNTLIIVEHDPDTIRAADHVVDFGPGAGVRGGRVIYQGDVAGLLEARDSLTGQYLSGRRAVSVPRYRRALDKGALRILGATAHNLKALDVEIPLGLMVCVTGVSGSGKSTLVHDVLVRGLRRRLYRSPERPGAHRRMEGLELVDKVVDIDQSPIGRTPRSNPATYVGAFSVIRDLFSQTPTARVRGYRPGRFSFNVRGGRCEACEGEGTRRAEMHFLPDVYVPCDDCSGSRYNRETLQVLYKGKNIAQVLALTVSEALELFANVPRLEHTLRTLCEVGLDYVTLGQAATTLSGGEAQRVKLARELSKLATGGTLYVLDEPTTGLHFADVEKLLEVLQRLVDGGNSVVIIEHNLDVIKTADHVIDLGPEGGEQGGRIVVAGTPEQVAACAASHTGRHLAGVLAGR